MEAFDELIDAKKELHITYNFMLAFLGLHEWCVFSALFELIEMDLPEGVKLSKMNMLLIFFMKVCLNMQEEIIAHLFGVHQTTVSRHFHRVLDV